MACPSLEDTLQLVIEAHRGQKDKAGEPYVLHVLRVMLRVKSHEERTVALLHDVLEDTDVTDTSLTNNYLYPDEIVYAVDLLTRKDGEPYMDYVMRCKTNALARTVKTADLLDHIEADNLTPVLSISQVRKYTEALKVITHR